MEGFLTRAKLWPLMPPNFSLRISRVHLWERFIFLQNLCLLLFFFPRINKHSERRQKYLLLPSKPIYPHLQSSEVPIIYWDSWKSITSNNIYTFLAKGPFWTCTSLNARKKKNKTNLVPPERKFEFCSRMLNSEKILALCNHELKQFFKLCQRT